VVAPELPTLPTRCTIALDGFMTDWSTAPCNLALNNFTFAGSPGISQGGITVSHHAHPSPGAPFDTLYLYLGVTGDGVNDGADDNLVLMFDKNHDASLGTGNERGIRFRRDKTADSVGGNPSAPVSLGSFSGATCAAGERICVITVGMDWSVEAKLIPSDFGMHSFAGTVGLVIALRDKNTSNTTSNWPTGSSDAPTTWADLKLGNPIDLMLVLDLSGSMRDQTCTPAPCESKLQKLQAAAGLLVGLFNAVASPADRIGVRYFSTNVTAYPVPPPALVSVLDRWSTVKTNIEGQMADGWTAMGGGLQCAINDLKAGSTPGLQCGINDVPDPTRTRAIILFTDGMQNVDPMVHEDGAGNLTIQNEGLSLVSNVPPTMPNAALNTGLGINVNAVGMGGAMDNFTLLLGKIANKTGGNYDATTDPNDLQSLFVNQLTYALRSHSPQLLGYRLGTVSNTTATEVFTANSDARKIVFAVTWPRGDSLTFRVEKDNLDVTSAGQTVATELYRIVTVPLPTRVQGTDISSGGDWRLLIQGSSGVPYQAMAIIDEPFLEYDVSFEDRDYAVGDSLRLRARVMYAGQPVTNARVTATVLKPKLSIGTLLSLNATPTPLPNVRPDTTPAQTKLQRLLADPAVRVRLQPSAQDVVLTGRGNGTYTANVAGTSIAGPYTAHFRVAGSRPDIGSYRRVRTASRVVRFGKADFAASAVRVTSLGVSADGRRLSLYLRPTDGTNYLGPEYGSRIKVSLTTGTVGPATDLLDGGYTFPLRVPENTDPVITLTVMGEPLYRGTLSRLEPRPPNAFSLHAGISLPHVNLKTAYKNGFGITADFEHRLSSTFRVAALLGYHRFETVTTGAHLDLYHVSGSLETFLTPGPLLVFIDAGGGVYRLNPGATKAGAHGGVNLEYEVSSSLSLGGSYRFHKVFTSGSTTTFSSVQAGGHVRF